MTSKRRKWLIIALAAALIVVTFAAYFKVFRAEFVYDDFAFIVNNKDIQSFTPLAKFLLSPDIFTGSRYVTGSGGGKNWRPVASFAFAVEYSLFGLNSSGFHFASVLLHILNVVLIYVLFLKLTKKIWPAAAASLLWAIHPVNTEAVSWVSNQSSLIFFGFFILAALAILRYIGNRNQKIWIRISYVLFVLSLLSKETALGGIFIIPFVFLWGYRERGKIDLRGILTDSSPFWAMGLVYFYLHYKILGAVGDHALRGSFLQNLLLAPAVFFKYISLIFYPLHLTVNYADFPLPSGIGDPRVILGTLFFLIFAALAYWGIKNFRFAFGLGVVWFLAFLSPVLQIIPFHDLVGERFLYAPLAGFFLSAAAGFDWLFNYGSKRGFNPRRAVAVAMALVLILFFALTLNRNDDWLNSPNLWNSVLRLDPKNEIALSNLGAYYVNNNQPDKVIEYAAQLLKIHPENAADINLMGVGLAMSGRAKEAEAEFLLSLSKNPDYQPAWISLATLYQNEGLYGKAIEILKNLSSKYPASDDIKARLARLEGAVAPLGGAAASGRNSGRSYVESEVQAPAVEGNIVNSGAAGRIILADGRPCEASLDIFKSDEMSKPFISVRSDNNGAFQIPLVPGDYILKPLGQNGLKPAQSEYPFTIGAGRWVQIKIIYE